MGYPRISDKVGGECRVTAGRALWAFRFQLAVETSTSLMIRPKALWRKANHCERSVYRHFWDKGADWEP